MFHLKRENGRPLKFCLNLNWVKLLLNFPSDSNFFDVQRRRYKLLFVIEFQGEYLRL